MISIKFLFISDHRGAQTAPSLWPSPYLTAAKHTDFTPQSQSENVKMFLSPSSRTISALRDDDLPSTDVSQRGPAIWSFFFCGSTQYTNKKKHIRASWTRQHGL